jgi:MHS family proline/betaine transporter-like MFS transporter
MLTWGWRIPLLLSAPFGLVALFMRLRLDESAAYENAHAEGPTNTIATSFGARSSINGSPC